MKRPLRYFWRFTLVVAAATSGCARTTPPDPRADAELAANYRADLVSGATSTNGSTAAATGTGWATLAGTFTYDGTPPARQPLLVNKDPAVCAPGGARVLDDVLLVDAQTHGIQNVVIYLRRASRVHQSAMLSAAAAMEEFDQKQCLFVTHVQPLLVGQTLTLANSDSIAHNIKTDLDSFNQTIGGGASIPFAPKSITRLPVAVNCSIHPWMQAFLMVHDNGYVAVTGPDGKFELANLPAGEDLELQVWHENAVGGAGLALDTPAARELGWTSQGRFQVKLTENETKTIELKVPPTAFRRTP